MSSAANLTVLYAWSAEDETMVAPAAEGDLVVLRDDDALQAAFTRAASGVAPAVVFSPRIALAAGRRHIMRVIGSTPTTRGAYLSVCLVGDPTRELLSPEAATIAWDGSGHAAAQVCFSTPPGSGAADYAVRLRFRGEPVTNATAVVLHRVLLIEDGNPCAPATTHDIAAPLNLSIFPDLASLHYSAEVTGILGLAAVLGSDDEPGYTRRAAAGHALVLGAVDRDVSGVLAGTKPAIDLRSVYGATEGRARLLDERGRFRIDGAAGDLARDSYGAPLVADPRADASYLDAQTHLLLLRFHNRVMDHFANAEALQGSVLSREVLFLRARQCVVTHWQWAVFYDTVLLLTDVATFRDVCASGQRFYRVYSPDAAAADPPAEYTHALAHVRQALRRDSYPLAQTGTYLTEAQSRAHVRGSLPASRLDLAALFDAASWPAGALDPYVAAGTALSDSSSPVTQHLTDASGAVPSGHDIALTMGVAPLTAAELDAGDRTGVIASLGMSPQTTPLLSYLLRESESRAGGQHLTGVGSRLLVETVRGLIWSAAPDVCCFRNQWRPSLPRARSETYTMADLVAWVEG